MTKLTAYSRQGVTFLRIRRKRGNSVSVVETEFRDGETVQAIADKLIDLAKYLNPEIE